MSADEGGVKVDAKMDADAKVHERADMAPQAQGPDAGSGRGAPNGGGSAAGHDQPGPDQAGDGAKAEAAEPAADDLAALAGGLSSLPAADGGGGEDDADLAALGALAARSTLAGGEDAPLRLRGGLPPGAAEPAERADAAEAAAPAKPDAARAGPGASDARSSAPRIATAEHAATQRSARAPSRARGGWLLPLLIGIGVGAGAAAVMFSMSRRAEPAAASAASSPVVSSAEPVARAPVQAAGAASAPALAAAAATTTETPAPVEPVREAPPARAAEPARQAAAARPVHEVPPAQSSAAPAMRRTEAEQAPVLSVRPAGQASAESAPSDRDPQDAEKLDPSNQGAAKTRTSMDALLDEALSPAARRNELAARQQAALAADALPPMPSRQQVTQTMTVLLPAIRGCAMGQSGLATASIVVHGDGRVASVDIAGAPFAGTASGRCMEGVIRRARFPQFAQPAFRLKFPLAIE